MGNIKQVDFSVREVVTRHRYRVEGDSRWWVFLARIEVNRFTKLRDINDAVLEQIHDSNPGVEVTELELVRQNDPADIAKLDGSL